MTGVRWVGLFGLVLTLIVSAGTPAHAGQRLHKVVRASWYGNAFKGRTTAAGSAFNPQHLTAAHRTLDLGSRVKVTELRSGRSVVVKITDRGPYQPGRELDLSYAAAKQLGIVRRGVARVRVEVLEREPQIVPAPVVTALAGTTASWLPQAIVE